MPKHTSNQILFHKIYDTYSTPIHNSLTKESGIACLIAERRTKEQYIFQHARLSEPWHTARWHAQQMCQDASIYKCHCKDSSFQGRRRVRQLQSSLIFKYFLSFLKEIFLFNHCIVDLIKTLLEKREQIIMCRAHWII